MIKVVITKLPIASFNYFQWFLLGLNILNKNEEIKLRYRINLLSRTVLLWCNSKWVAGVARRIVNIIDKRSKFNLVGKVISENKEYCFTIDPKDSPFIFDTELLEKCDCYFKIQCPKEINKDGFQLSRNCVIPWFDINFGASTYGELKFSRTISEKVYMYKDKIRPAMQGPRRLAWGCKFSAMKRQYEKYLDSQSISHAGKLCAYFRTDRGPKPVIPLHGIDPDLEWELMGSFPINHPNEKRGIVVRIMNEMNDPQIDGRIIAETDSSTGETLYHKDKEIPLTDFCDWLANYEYNLNVSGFRLSIPSRFIESFISGSSIVTDKLAVKWYLPFEEEVIETVKMGYEPLDEVDFDQFKKDIKALPAVKKERIIDLYNRKWSPIAFARYIISETLTKS